jgi:hypothetical protein
MPVKIGRHYANSENRWAIGLQMTHRDDHRLGTLKDLHRMFEKEAPCCCQLHWSHVAYQQHTADLSLELSYSLTEGRLSYMEILGRARKAPVSGYVNKVTETLQVNLHIESLSTHGQACANAEGIGEL